MQIAAHEQAVEFVDDLFSWTNRPASRGFGQDFLEGPDGEGGVHRRVSWAYEANALPFVETRLEQLFHAVVERLEFGGEGGIESWGEGKQELREGRVIEQDRDDAADVVLDLRFDVGVWVDVQNGRSEARKEPVDEFYEDRPFVWEVQVKRAFGDARPGDDVVDFRRVITLGREHVSCGAEQLETTLGLVHGCAFYHL